MRILLVALSFVFALGMMASIAVAFWGVHSFNKSGPLSEPTLTTIRPGSSLSVIARDLESIGAIDNPLIFKLGTRAHGADSKLKAGEYKLDPGMSNAQIMDLLREGKTFQRRVTIAEGLTVFEIIERLNEISALQGDVIDIPKEGALLPETYNYSLEEDRQIVINRMRGAMSDLRLAVTNHVENKKSQTESFPLSLFVLCVAGQDETQSPSLKDDACWHKVLTLASIVEKETGVPHERKKVAGVFLNRLKRGMPLQTDPTVIYAITKGQHKNEGTGPLGRRLLLKDLSYDSPYNTYLYPGLPPGPIANPGRDAIEAVIYPESHDYIYFVADGTGGHAFGRTLEEHNANVAKWRKIRRSQD